MSKLTTEQLDRFRQRLNAVQLQATKFGSHKPKGVEMLQVIDNMASVAASLALELNNSLNNASEAKNPYDYLNGKLTSAEQILQRNYNLRKVTTT